MPRISKDNGGGAVSSVNEYTGDVVLDADDIGDGTANKAFTSTLKNKLDGLTAQVTEIKTSNYTVVTGDKGKLIISDHASTNPQQITMGTGLGWSVGDSITILNGHNSRDLQITKSGWIYWNDVSANITLKPYQGIKITNVETDYYLTQTFNTFTPTYATALANLLDPIKKVQHTYSQNPNSANFNSVQGTSITPSETAYYKYVAVVPVKIPDLNVTAVWLKSLRSCYDFRAKITAPNGTVTHFRALGSVTDVNTEFSIDTSGASVNDIWLVEIEFFVDYGSSSQSIRTKLVGSGYFSIEQANAYLMKVG